jgi:hypothetical protein
MGGHWRIVAGSGVVSARSSGAAARTARRTEENNFIERGRDAVEVDIH